MRYGSVSADVEAVDASSGVEGGFEVDWAAGGAWTGEGVEVVDVDVDVERKRVRVEVRGRASGRRKDRYIIDDDVVCEKAMTPSNCLFSRSNSLFNVTSSSFLASTTEVREPPRKVPLICTLN